MQALFTEPAVRAERVCHTVGVEQQRVTRFDRHRRFAPVAAGIEPEQDAGPAELDGRLLTAVAQRQRVAGRRDGHARAVLIVGDSGHHGGDQRQVSLLEQQAVQQPQDPARGQPEQCGRPSRVARERGQRCRPYALAGHVADDQRERLLAAEQVVEIAADLAALLAGVIQRGGSPAAEGRQPGWSEAPLQRPGRIAALLVEARVLGRAGGASSEVLGESQIVGVEAVPRLCRDERDCAEHAVARAHRHDHQRAHLELAHELQLRLVAHPCGQQLVRDDGVEHRTAGAQHKRHAERVLEPRRMPGAELPDEFDLGRVHVRHGELTDLARLEQVDRAPVR